MPKVIVGMSGGVDSSVTAYLLREQGFEVEGISFLLWEARKRSDFTACCSLESTRSAAKTAAQLGVRHDCVDVRGEFIEKVMEPFADCYARGMTPNPCVLCNRHIKFPYLAREAKMRGAEYIATGHYASTVPAGRATMLRKGKDPGKDQSYVLYVLNPEELGMLLLPLGNMMKSEVRSIARSLGLDAAERPESQEICFIEDNDYAAFVEELRPRASMHGPIVDGEGRTLGAHRGICRYTIGQRKGLGIASPEPWYVTGIDAASNTVMVGSVEKTMTAEVLVTDLNWLSAPAESPFRATVKVRSMMQDRPALLRIVDRAVRVVFDDPQFAPAPGQSAVFYDGETVLGGGTIAATGPEKPLNR